MAKATEESVSAYMRIPRSAYDTLQSTATLLNMPLAKVTNALFNFTFAPQSFQADWALHVRALRASIAENEAAKRRPNVCLYDFSAMQWDTEKHATYTWLERMGLVEDFMWRRGANQRVLCSFRISDTGRVIAEVFKNCWITEPPDEEDINQSDDEAQMIG